MGFWWRRLADAEPRFGHPAFETCNTEAQISAFLLNVDCGAGYEKGTAENSLLNRSLTFQGNQKLRPLLKLKECQQAVAKSHNALIKLASRGLSKLQPLKLYSPPSLLCACCNSISAVMHPLGLHFNHPLSTKQQLRRFQICFLQAILQEIIGKVLSCWFSSMIKFNTSPFN